MSLCPTTSTLGRPDVPVHPSPALLWSNQELYCCGSHNIDGLVLGFCRQSQGDIDLHVVMLVALKAAADRWKGEDMPRSDLCTPRSGL